MSTDSVILFENEAYGGYEQELGEEFAGSPNLPNFPNGVRSIILRENAEQWHVFTQAGYHGAKVILQPGRRYTSLDAMGLGYPVRSLRKFAIEKTATVVLFEEEWYGGRTQELHEKSADAIDLKDFPNGVKSIILQENAKKWQVFPQAGYQGVSVNLEPGRRYTSLDDMGLGTPVKSMKRFSGDKADVNTET